MDASEAIEVSAKSGIGIGETLEAIVNKLPAPTGDVDAPLKAMLVDSWYDAYLGVVVLVRIMDGKMQKGDRVKMMSNGTLHTIDRIGVFKPQMENVDCLYPGEIGLLLHQLNRFEILELATRSRTTNGEQIPRCLDLNQVSRSFLWFISC